MARAFEAGGVLLGLAILVVGMVLQTAGASAWVYCSVGGAGIVLALVAAGIWVIRALRHRKPGPVAA